MIRKILAALSSYTYPLSGRLCGKCASNAGTLGASIHPFWRVRVGGHSRVAHTAILSAGTKGEIIIGEHCFLHRQVMLLSYGGRIELGNYVSVNPFSILYGHGGLSIGNNVAIAAGTIIIPANHIFSDPGKLIQEQGFEAKGIKIEDDVWIGAHVTVLDGVTISKGSVIGAGSVVDRDIPPYSIAVGVPCRVIRHRQ